MKLDQDICYRALQTRDARFDGHFFTAVLTTKIYCRPICPARIPLRQNCLFLPSAAAAQGAGYRSWPGLRVPGAWDGFELAVRAILGLERKQWLLTHEGVYRKNIQGELLYD
jgi:AraC family transcriptional regulator, regulatory protein of adaptative response / DNA-3-methyladenine glycosylase II